MDLTFIQVIQMQTEFSAYIYHDNIQVSHNESEKKTVKFKMYYLKYIIYNLISETKMI